MALNLTKCSNCAEEVTADSDFCPHCGVLIGESHASNCETHTRNVASGVCIICRILVCRDCSKIVNGRTLCGEHSKVEVRQDWAKVFQSTEINDSELAKSVLETAGFRVLVQNFSSVGYAWDGGGDSPQSRSNLSRPAKVFVPIPEYLGALKAIEEWKSAATESE